MRVVTKEMFEALFAEHKSLLGLGEVKRKADAYYAERSEFDLASWISRHLPDAKERDWNEGRKWILPVCPFNSEHDRGEACIVQLASGAVSAKCQHDSCVWGWTDLRGKLEPEYAERKERASAPQRKLSDRQAPPEVLYEDPQFAAEIDAIADRDREPSDDAAVPTSTVLWWTAPQLVDEILARAKDPWIDLTLGGESLCRIRSGGTAVVIGGSGSGKSSLVANMLVEHAVNIGPAIALSIELPADELGARIVGMKNDATWEQALRGEVRREDMERALALPRLYVLDRRRATLKNLEKCVDAVRAKHVGEPILVAIDYAQLLDSKEREARMRVADAFAQIDDCAREKKFVAIALSQMSRAAARTARKGEAIGAESSDLGAETAAIERFATVTLSIGLATEREDGTSAVELSVGKARMGKGDRVVPMSYEGRTGRWRIAGEAKSAEQVREQRDTARAEKEQRAIDQQIVGALTTSTKAMSGTDLCELVTGRKAKVRAAVKSLLATGKIVEIAVRAARSKSWLLWTEDRARAAGAPLVRDTILRGSE